MAERFLGDDEQEFNREEKDLPLENELLKIKIAVESGGQFDLVEDMSPEQENYFLKHVEHFHETYREFKTDKVYNLIGQPQFVPANKLTDYEFYPELKKIQDIMQQHKINLKVRGDYDPDVIYRFITEELFEEEIPVITNSNLAMELVYEDFHPNLEVELQDTADAFLELWFDRRFDENFPMMNELTTIHKDVSFTIKEAAQKVRNFFDCFLEFRNTDRGMDYVEYKWNEEVSSETGYVVGTIYYKGILESGEEVVLDGPFGLYFYRQDNRWYLYSFNISGFKWITE